MVRINISESAVAAKVQGAFQKGLYALSTEILEDCNAYCKEADGTLKESAEIHSIREKGLLIWQTPYARRQYWAIRTAYKDKNPNATWKWCEVAKKHRVLRWKKLAEKAVRDNL